MKSVRPTVKLSVDKFKIKILYLYNLWNNNTISKYVLPKTAALDGIAFDEIVVESNLNIRQKPLPPMRRLQRNPITNIRAKRQFNEYFPQQSPFNHQGQQQHHHGHNGGQQHGFNGQQQYQQQGFNGQQQYPGFVQQQPFGGFNNNQQQQHYGGSSSSSNANSHSSGFGPQGFGSAAASAQAQGFETDGPFGGFGASAANADTQSFQVGPNGFQANIII